MEFKKCSLVGVFLITAIALGAFPAAAEVTLSNFAEPDLCSGSYCWGTTNSAWGAQQFSTGENGWTINRIDVLVNPIGDPALRIAVYSDENGQPGTQIGNLLTFSGSVELGTFDRHSYISDGSIFLGPGALYWFVFGATGGGNGNPQYQQTDDSLDSSGPWSITGNEASTSNSGASWNTYTDSEVTKFEIDATYAGSAVPTSSTYGIGVFLILTLSAAILMIRRESGA